MLILCRCGRRLATTNRAGRCKRCNQRRQVKAFAAYQNSGADVLTEAIRQARVLIYQARAALRLPLFDPPIVD